MEAEYTNLATTGARWSYVATGTSGRTSWPMEADESKNVGQNTCASRSDKPLCSACSHLVAARAWKELLVGKIEDLHA
jgi:hypothetical protein